MHMHSIAAEIEIGKVEAKFDKESGKKLATTFLKSGDKGICVVKVRVGVCSVGSRSVYRSLSLCLGWEGSLFVMRGSTDRLM